MIHFKQGELVDMFCEKIRKLVPTRTGTYNTADPTHFEKYNGEVWVTHGYGEYWQEDYETGETIFIDGKSLPDEPPPIQVEIEIMDCTWGIEFMFTTDIGECGAYWSRESNSEGGEWMRVNGNFFEVFKDLLAEGDANNPYESDCPHGYLEMYE